MLYKKKKKDKTKKKVGVGGGGGGGGDSPSELHSSLCERRLRRAVLRPALLPVKTAQFTQFFHHV